MDTKLALVEVCMIFTSCYCSTIPSGSQDQQYGPVRAYSVLETTIPQTSPDPDIGNPRGVIEGQQYTSSWPNGNIIGGNEWRGNVRGHQDKPNEFNEQRPKEIEETPSSSTPKTETEKHFRSATFSKQPQAHSPKSAFGEAKTIPKAHSQKTPPTPPLGISFQNPKAQVSIPNSAGVKSTKTVVSETTDWVPYPQYTRSKATKRKNKTPDPPIPSIQPSRIQAWTQAKEKTTTSKPIIIHNGVFNTPHQEWNNNMFSTIFETESTSKSTNDNAGYRENEVSDDGLSSGNPIYNLNTARDPRNFKISDKGVDDEPPKLPQRSQSVYNEPGSGSPAEVPEYLDLGNHSPGELPEYKEQGEGSTGEVPEFREPGNGTPGEGGFIEPWLVPAYIIQAIKSALTLRF